MTPRQMPLTPTLCLALVLSACATTGGPHTTPDAPPQPAESGLTLHIARAINIGDDAAWAIHHDLLDLDEAKAHGYDGRTLPLEPGHPLLADVAPVTGALSTLNEAPCTMTPTGAFALTPTTWGDDAALVELASSSCPSGIVGDIQVTTPDAETYALTPALPAQALPPDEVNRAVALLPEEARDLILLEDGACVSPACAHAWGAHLAKANGPLLLWVYARRVSSKGGEPDCDQRSDYSATFVRATIEADLIPFVPGHGAMAMLTNPARDTLHGVLINANGVLSVYAMVEGKLRRVDEIAWRELGEDEFAAPMELCGGGF